MIVREQGECFVLFKQYDHSVVSGIFAAHWKERPEPYDSVHYAIEAHDIGWEQLDQTVVWNERMNEPYSFTNYPLKEKLSAYSHGINVVAMKDSYAGYLCSRHLTSFFRNASDKESAKFRENEFERQQRLEQTFTKQQLDQTDYNFNLLKTCDDLSLFICLNEPGENTFPWYRDGFVWNGGTIAPEWKDRFTLTFSPNLFTRSFEITIPYQLVSRQRQVLQTDQLTIQIV